MDMVWKKENMGKGRKVWDDRVEGQREMNEEERKKRKVKKGMEKLKE